MERTKLTGKTETILSVAILTLLVGIGAAVYDRQFRFNPAVLTSTAQGLSASADERGADAGPPAAIVPLPDSIRPLSPPERFDAATLSDKINGKAELYLSAGFRQLETQRFRPRSTVDAWMELFVYDMGSPENAFAVYSSQQREDAQPQDVGRFSYRTANALYWVHGRYYAELIASGSSEAVLQAMQALAEAMVAGREVQAAGGVDLPSIFPSAHRQNAEVTLIPSDAFGFAGLDRVYTAEYELPAGAFTAFLSDRQSVDDAAAAAEAYRNFLLEFGGRPVESPTDAAGTSDLTVVEILGRYEVIFFRGRFLAGVHEAPEITPALELAKTLQERIDEFNASPSR